MAKRLAGGFFQVAARAEVQFGARRLAKTQQHFPGFDLARIQPQAGARRIMTCQLSRRLDQASRRAQWAYQVFDLLARNRAGPQQQGAVAIKTDYGGFNPQGGTAGIENEIQLAAQALDDVLGCGGGDLTRLVAEGPATGRPVSFSNATAAGCDGARKATVSMPALTSSDNGEFLRRGRTRVSAPGQNFSASA